MKSIRCGSGLGDSIYLQSVVRHLVEKGEEIEACSDWPDVFRPLNGRVAVSPFRREVDIRAHYAMRKAEPSTDQFEDVCIAAKIRGPVDLRLDWKPVNSGLVKRIRNLGGPVIAVQLPRRPMDRKDGFGAELLPNCAVIQRAIDLIGAKVVQIGSGDALHHFDGLALDLSNRTTVTDLIDVAYAVDGMLGYVSFFVPLAESLGKPALFVWSQRGLESRHEFIRQITPKKILHYPSSLSVMDTGEIASAVDELFDKIGSKTEVRRKEYSDCRLRAGSAG